MVDSLDRAIENNRRYGNKNLDIRYLGDGTGSGDPRVRDNSGRFWVRKQVGENQFTQPVAYPLATSAFVTPKDNTPVKMGYEGQRECILGEYYEGVIQQGGAIANPADAKQVKDNVSDGTNQFRCTRSTDSSKPWTVVVESGFFEIDGKSYQFYEFEIDLSGLVPSAGDICVACVYVTKSLTLAAFASTAQLQPYTLTFLDVDECRQQAEIDDMSVWTWALDGNADGLTEDPTMNHDIRGIFTPPNSRSATLQTTDATTTTLVSIPVAELQMMTITATINGAKDDYTATVGGTLTAVVRRASGGDITLVGSVTVDIHEDSAGSPTFTLDVDTGTQTARLRVTGIVAEVWNWVTRYQTLMS